jgi:hypothetical protein
LKPVFPKRCATPDLESEPKVVCELAGSSVYSSLLFCLFFCLFNTPTLEVLGPI